MINNEVPSRPKTEGLAESLAEFLSHLLASGQELPFHFAAIGANGAIIAGHYHESPAGTLAVEAEYDAGHAFVAPINVVVVDSQGDAACMVLRRGSSEMTEGARVS